MGNLGGGIPRSPDPPVAECDVSVLASCLHCATLSDKFSLHGTARLPMSVSKILGSNG